MIEKIISGGQTGVDRAALDVAINLSICYGGWCPKGRIDEAGIIPIKYNAIIEISGEFIDEKENYNAIQDGTVLTIAEAKERKKPFIIIGLNELADDHISKCVEWIHENDIKILNFAGPRESVCSGVYDSAFLFLMNLIPAIQYSHKLSI